MKNYLSFFITGLLALLAVIIGYIVTPFAIGVILGLLGLETPDIQILGLIGLPVGIVGAYYVVKYRTN